MGYEGGAAGDWVYRAGQWVMRCMNVDQKVIGYLGWAAR